MYEFAFFDEDLRARFVERLETLGVEALDADPAMPLSVGVSEDVADRMLDRIEACYDELLDAQAELTEAQEPDAVSRIGVQFRHADGEVGVVRLDPGIARRLLKELSYEELQSLVQQVVDASQEPVRPLCKP